MPAITSLDLSNAKLDVDHIAAIATSSATTATDRLGHIKLTMHGIEKSMQDALKTVVASVGYAPPVTYSAGISITSTTQTVFFNGTVYAPNNEAVPFVTSGVFESSKFRVLQGVTANDLASEVGSNLVGYKQQGAGGSLLTLQGVLKERVSVKRFGAIGDGDSHPLSGYFPTLAAAQAVYPHAVSLSDEIDWCAIQACINYCAPQYDPTETTHDGNNFSQLGVSKTIHIDTGIFVINRTVNASFRNMFALEGESEWNSVIRWNGPDNGVMINAKCSNYVAWSKFTLDGAHKAMTFIYQAGNGVNAPNSKGNTTGNYFGHIYFWNQIGFLTGTAPDFPDQYDPLTAMLCITSVDAPSWYNSMDDSLIEYCRFAPNSLNNNFGIAMSSTTVPINQCWFGCANSVLVSNGASVVMNQCTSSNAAPAISDDQHNHAVLKFAYTGIAYVYATKIDCYHESMDYYGNGNSSILAYFAQGPSSTPDNQSKIQQLVIRGGLYSCGKNNTRYIEIGNNRRANIIIDNATFQGLHKGYIYAPDSSIDITNSSNATSDKDNNSVAWQPTAYKSLHVKYATPDFSVCGQSVPDAVVAIGSVDDPARLCFLSLDEALPFVSAAPGTVIIYMQKNDTITKPASLNSNIFLALQTYTLNINATVNNFGKLTVVSNFSDSIRSGAIVSSTFSLKNHGNMLVKNISLTSAVTADSGTATFDNIEFLGLSDAILVGDSANVVINSDNCVYPVVGFVANLGNKLSRVSLKSSTGIIPSFGKWMRGTVLEFTNPAKGFPNIYYATADGVGPSANWAKNGNLS